MNKTFCSLFILSASLAVPSFCSAQIDSTGIKLIEQRKYVEARAYFDTALKRDNKNPETYFYLAVITLREGNPDDAEDLIDEALDLNDKNPTYHFFRGQILGEKAMRANVISQGFLAPKIKNAFLRAVELDPDHLEARIGLFNYYIMAPGIMGGSEEKAMEQAKEIVRINPYRGHLMLARFYERKKDFTQAESEYKLAIIAGGTKTGGYKSLGYFYINQKKYPLGIEQMKKYIELDPKNPDSYDSLGDVFAAEEKYDLAIEQYLYALYLDKTFSPSIYSLARAYEKKGLKEKAKETYQWYLSAAPKGRYADDATKKIKELS